MKPEEFSKLSDDDLQNLARNNKPSPLFDAFFIGFLVGIIIYSVVGNTWGMVTIIPLYLIYRFLKKPKQYEAIQKELKTRNLK